MGFFALGADALAQDELRFVGCPIYRDTNIGRKSGCWLVDDPIKGIRYDVSRSPGKPDWNYSILVEGRVAAKQDNACGGIILDPARVSIVAKNCPRTVFPPGEYPGRPYVLAARRLRPTYADRTPAAAPFATKTFTVGFEYNRDFVTYELSDYYLEQATNYALDVGTAQITVLGYADTRPSIVSGVPIREDKKIARLRAQRVEQWLIMRGLARRSIKVSWKVNPRPSGAEVFDGLVAPSTRRVDITVTPLPPVQ